jgi:hypothetical protein
MEFVFVAAPYSHVNPDIRQKRVNAVEEGIAKLIPLFPNWLFINPLSMHHVAVKNLKIPTDYPFWKKHSHALIQKCDIFLVMNQIRGFYSSKGLQDEFSYFQQIHPKKKIINFKDII